MKEDSFTSPIAQYVEEGYTAVDNCDGDLTLQVIREEREGIVYYTVSDSSGNQTTVERKIVYKDAVSPVITLNGKKEIKIGIGTAFTDPGCVAMDDCDGNLTSNVVVSGNVNTQKMGVYEVTYEVSDSSGNKQIVTRTVEVCEKQEAEQFQEEKVVYLTFDDGPGQYTERLLDILDKYGVKATFFVTNQYSTYQHLIGEIYRRGHTLALHTYNHKYNEIYRSQEAYYEDLNKIRQICIEETGIAPSLVRFPGGTSNTVSRKYCTGIMTALSKSLVNKGYSYCDWNVSSEDTGATKTRKGVFDNVIAGIKKNDVSIVLQHDIRGYSVEAVDDIIAWGFANGYTFLPMTEDTKMIHFSPQN